MADLDADTTAPDTEATAPQTSDAGAGVDAGEVPPRAGAPDPPEPPPASPPPEPPAAETVDASAILAELAEQRRALDEQRAQIEAQRDAARDAALDRLGVLPAYRSMAPTADPFTEEGRSELQEWADAHPEIVRRAPTGDRPKMAEITKKLAKAPGAWLVDTDLLGSGR